MSIDNGAKLHVAANVSEMIDGIELALPAGDYRALAVGPVDGEEAGDEVERFLLLPLGRERAHPISAEGLAQLAEHERVEVTETGCQRWLGSSGQISALDKWSLCRLPLGAVFGMARREGVARPE